MNELVKKETITSLELVKEINMFREQEGRRTELQHCDLLKVIRDEFEDEIGVGKISESYYMNSQNKKQPMFVLTYQQAKQVLVRESKFVRRAVIAYINKLEEALNANTKVPTSFAEALRLAADQQEQIEQQQKQLEMQKPKVDFYDAVTDSKDTFDMAAVAKVLNMGIGRTKLFSLLRENKVLRANNEPFQAYIDNGWMRQIETTFNLPDGSQKIYRKTVVFQKGLDGIRRLIINKRHKE